MRTKTTKKKKVAKKVSKKAPKTEVAVSELTYSQIEQIQESVISAMEKYDGEKFGIACKAALHYAAFMVKNVEGKKAVADIVKCATKTTF